MRHDKKYLYNKLTNNTNVNNTTCVYSDISASIDFVVKLLKCIKKIHTILISFVDLLEQI